LIYITPLTVCVYLHSNFSAGRRKTFFIFIYFYKTGVSAVQGHPRSINLVPIESAGRLPISP